MLFLKSSDGTIILSTFLYVKFSILLPIRHKIPFFLANPALTRQLVTLGYDTLEITNNAGKVVKQWQLTTLLALQ